MSVVTSEEFNTSADAYRVRCTVPILIQLSEENVATQPAPPVLAFQIPQTSLIACVGRPLLEKYSRYLAEPSNPQQYWLSRGTGGKDPIAWSMSVGLLAEIVVNEQLVSAAATAAANSENQNINNNSANLSTSGSGGLAPGLAAASASAALSAATAASTKPPFPIKLFVNFRHTKRHDLFPFFAQHMGGIELKTALVDSTLHSLKRSVAIMNSNSYAKFLGDLNPTDMKRLKDFCLMDSPSVTVRSDFAQFHKQILGTIDVEAWPVMVHSLETGRTLTLAIPSKVRSGGKAMFRGGPSSSSSTSVSSMSARSPNQARSASTTDFHPAGIQAASAAARSTAETDHATPNTAAAAAPPEPAIFNDVVIALATKMNPQHLPHTADGQQMQELLRRRLRIGGLPIVPPAETPLRWLMEHMVGADLGLHVLLLPPSVVVA